MKARRIATIVLITGSMGAQTNVPIPLQVNPPNTVDPLDTARKILELREMQERTRQLQEQNRQIEEQRAATRRSAEEVRLEQLRKMQVLNDQAAALAKAGKAQLTMRELVGDAEYSLLGLDTLPVDKQTAIDRWVSLYSLNLAQQLEVLLRPASTPAVVETKIDGSFAGWSGDTVFKLSNGQVWKQSAYAYMYSYAFSPEVVIYSTGGGFKMKVDGISGSVEVTRIK